VQRHKGVGIIPVPTGLAVHINDDDIEVRLLDDHIGERHSRRTTTNDKIICTQFNGRQNSTPEIALAPGVGPLACNSRVYLLAAGDATVDMHSTRQMIRGH